MQLVYVHSLTWAWFWISGCQLLRNDLGDSVSNNRWNAHQRRRTKSKIIQFFLSRLIRNLKCMQPPRPRVLLPVLITQMACPRFEISCTSSFLLCLAPQPLPWSLYWLKKHLWKPGSCCWTPGEPGSPLGHTGQTSPPAHTESPGPGPSGQKVSLLRKKMAKVTGVITEASVEHFIRQSYIFISIGDEALSFYWEF